MGLELSALTPCAPGPDGGCGGLRAPVAAGRRPRAPGAGGMRRSAIRRCAQRLEPAAPNQRACRRRRTAGGVLVACEFGRTAWQNICWIAAPKRRRNGNGRPGLIWPERRMADTAADVGPRCAARDRNEWGGPRSATSSGVRAPRPECGLHADRGGPDRVLRGGDPAISSGGGPGVLTPL